MFARLWWKEARQTWPAWGFLACVGLALQGLVRLLAGEGQEEGYVVIAGLVAVIYLFLIAAAVFAGEREAGTLGMLDALPIDRLRLWGAKASFALGTTLALGLLLWLSAVAYMGFVPNLFRITGAALIWGGVALGWGLLWSAVLGNAMHAAVLAMASLGATLAALVNLQEGPTTEAAPLLIAIGLATAAASAFAFVRTGPPRWEPHRARPVPEAVERAEASATAAVARRPARAWTYSVGRLAWETWRQVRMELKVLLAVALGGLAFNRLTEWNRQSFSEILVIATAFVAMMTGISTFNGENRGRTHRFLDQHGVRPGVAWAVKLVIWWSTMIALCGLVHVRNLRWLPDVWRAPGIYGAGTIVAGVLGGLTFPFALGTLCGMVFRRGIMAGSIAVVGLIVLGYFLGASLALGIAGPFVFLYPALALLAVSWAWSGDWLRFAPGFGKWARLALWCGAAAAVLVSGYIGGRAWDVPTLPADQAQSLFQPESFGQPSPPDEDAAPLYREAERLVLAVAGSAPADRSEKVDSALAIVRKAALLPNCDYEDPRKATIFTLPQEPSYAHLVNLLSDSARARLGRGDLDGSWDEVETLLRMARQYSKVRGWAYFSIEPQAVGLAMEWAADPGQTAASLERALASYRSLPGGFTPADRARLDRNAFRNTANLPQDDLIDLYLRGYVPRRKKVDTTEAIGARILTTPWEMARARKVYDLLAGSWIQMLGDRPYAALPLEPGPHGMGWRALPLDSHRTLTLRSARETVGLLGPAELSGFEASTPIVRLDLPGKDGVRYPRIEAERRALAMVLRLRLYQARHDGALPHSLDELPPPLGSRNSDDDPERHDPFAGDRFGYIPSSGQPLIPLADMPSQGYTSVIDRRILKPSDGCWLLYSVGPDLKDERAARNLGNMQVGDLVYPLKDGVKPPAAGAP
ncbi:MAG: hypothetical protein BGO49_27540 [Planctomycetales bacterium 71-10]|nr:MAG: hypothetical protein BGO49_27540 [Planctomycetales bacterium 71-10]